MRRILRRAHRTWQILCVLMRWFLLAALPMRRRAGQTFDQRKHDHEVEGLGQSSANVRAKFCRRVSHLVCRRQNNHWHARPPGLTSTLVQKCSAVHDWHRPIQEYQIHLPRFMSQVVESFRAVAGGVDDVSVLSESLCEYVTEVAIVVHTTSTCLLPTNAATTFHLVLIGSARPPPRLITCNGKQRTTWGEPLMAETAHLVPAAHSFLNSAARPST